MGPLVFAQDRKTSPLGRQNSAFLAGKRLWTGLRLLVVGPPGAGKMSLISVLSKALDPDIQLTIFDLEAEKEVQDVTLQSLAQRLAQKHSASTTARSEALILRHLHRLNLVQLRRLIDITRQEIDIPGENGEPCRIALHATCFEFPDWPRSARADLEALFPCQIHLTGMPATKADVSGFVLDVVGELNQRYGKRITEVESSVFDLLQRQASWRASLHELRNVLERAYFSESTSRLSKRTLEAAARR